MGKSSFALSLTLTAILSTSLYAHPQGGHPGKRAMMQFNRIDSNQDQLLSLQEMLEGANQRAQMRFSRKDADQNGLLSFDEATAERTPRDLSAIAAEIVLCVTDIQAETGNEDIQIPDIDRFISPEARFEQVDSNADDFIDLEEATAKAQEKATSHFNRADSDASGEISLKEFMSAKKQGHTTRRAIGTCIEELTAD